MASIFIVSLPGLNRRMLTISAGKDARYPAAFVIIGGIGKTVMTS